LRDILWETVGLAEKERKVTEEGNDVGWVKTHERGGGKIMGRKKEER